jgi:enoyl-[acyl-carrier protein] reductase II
MGPATLRFAPPAVSFHIGVIPELVERAHAAGCVWIQQVIDREQAERALEAGADVLVAQGGEAGGHGGWVGTMVLVPEVVDLAGAVPVVAAGGIADGRGVAAALALGAQGALVGTRLLASEEMAVSPEWKRRVVEASALDAVKVPHSERVLPPYNRPGSPADPRALRTPLIERLGEAPESVDPTTAGPELLAALREDRPHEYLPFAGQSAALVHDVRPAAEIVRELVEGVSARCCERLSSRAAS